MTNTGYTAQPVTTYPIWSGGWAMPGRSDAIRWWDALTFVQHDKALKHKTAVNLLSRVHSSDEEEDGVNPYWATSGDAGFTYFSLDWCGGWEASLSMDGDRLLFNARLTGDEVDLVLEPGESIEGPVMNVTFTREADEVLSRAAWIGQRRAMADLLYGGPSPTFPFIWNHWYTVRFDLTSEFIERQAAAARKFGFDYFVVDAGWYEGCGMWRPDPAKFAPGQFEKAMAFVRDQGIKPGIWTCPQFIEAPADNLPPEVDQPGFYRKFIDGHLIDMAGTDFSTFLVDHVQSMQDDYFAKWWKYDQDFFTVNKTRQGRMKNVVAFQDALLAVRKEFPDLYIENCQSGGRMINEFTVLLTQGQWIRDGGGTGKRHARSNFEEVLGAIAFMPPWTAMRWTNRPDENNQGDDEFTRMYCRSAMPGVWGVVADLPEIGFGQKQVILQEAAHYRRLNEIKRDSIYDLYPTGEDVSTAGVAFYSADSSRAGILLMRWDKRGSFRCRQELERLDPNRRYTVEDVDTGETTTVDGKTLVEQGFTIEFPRDRDSAIVFIDAVE
jgi:hypothetical protein